MLAIKNNIMAATAARHLGKSYDALSQSVERLSSGLRINSAKDDAAGMAVRELIRADISVLNQGSRNGQDGISMLQTMEAAMGVMDENLVRMKELAEQAATGSYSSAQRAIMDAEFAEMADEIERVSNATKFNNISMLNETALASGANDVKIHVGTTTTIDVQKVNMTKAGLNIDTGDGGWTVSTSTANGTTSTSDTTWMVIRDGSGGDTTGVTMTVTFMDSGTTTNNESALVVGFGTATTVTGFSLASVVSQINTASMNLGWDTSGNDLRYSAAEAVYDSTSSKYTLKLSSRASNADTAKIVWAGLDTTGGTKGYVSGAFLVTIDATYSTSALLVASLGLASAGATQAGLNIQTVDAAVTALVRIESAINAKDTARAAFGYKMNRLESTVSILEIQAENLQAAESRISDVDVATEMAKLTSTQVLSQAGVQMLAQANSIPQMALTLLRG
jgi:flagellin